MQIKIKISFFLKNQFAKKFNLLIFFKQIWAKCLLEVALALRQLRPIHKKGPLSFFLSLPLWFNCNQMDMEVVIFIKYGCNTIVWAKIRHLRHFIQNVLGAKVHANCKILKFCQHFETTKTHVGIIFGIWFFLSEKTKLYRYYQKKNQLGVTSSSYINLTMKLLIKS